jgi:hypothetical protein
MHPKTLYNEPHQHRSAPPTSYESLLGDAIERAFAQGVHDLDGVVAYLNRSGPSAPNGEPWSSTTYQREMARLGA